MVRRDLEARLRNHHLTSHDSVLYSLLLRIKFIPSFPRSSSSSSSSSRPSRSSLPLSDPIRTVPNEPCRTPCFATLPCLVTLAPCALGALPPSLIYHLLLLLFTDYPHQPYIQDNIEPALGLHVIGRGPDPNPLFSDPNPSSCPLSYLVPEQIPFFHL